MGRSQDISYQGDTYRDDRIFVMNLSRGKVEINGEIYQKFVLVTYRNSLKFVATRADHFDTKEDAINYIKKIDIGNKINNYILRKIIIKDLSNMISLYINL